MSAIFNQIFSPGRALGGIFNNTISSPQAGPNFLLNLYPGAVVAFSFRKLNSFYAGPAVRVRRSSDNAESDIGFVNDVLDTVSLLSFVGAGNGFVTTWYDQTNNSRNATQTTAINQFQIVSSGVLNVSGALNRPAVLGQDTIGTAAGNKFMSAPMPTNFGLGDLTGFCVAKKNVNKIFQSVFQLNSPAVSGSGGGGDGSLGIQSLSSTTVLGIHNSWVSAAPADITFVDLGVNSQRDFYASNRRLGGVSGLGGEIFIRAKTDNIGSVLTNITYIQPFTSQAGLNIMSIGKQGSNLGTNNWPQNIMEIILWPFCLDTGSIEVVEASAGGFYGI
jgi:hypothetical protein